MPVESYAPVLPPPRVTMSPLGWLREYLFNTWYNTLLTLGLVVGLARVVPALAHWVFAVAHWQAVALNVRLFMVGLYPSDQNLAAWCVTAPAGLAVGRQYGLYPGANEAC